MDAPLTIRASQIDQIAAALRETSPNGTIAAFVNGRQVEVHHYGQSVTEALYYSTTLEPIRSVSIHNGQVDVWLAWAASAQSRSSDPRYLGALWRVRQILDGSKWTFGNMFVRYWGALVAVLAAILVILYSLDVQPTAQRDTIAITAVIGTCSLLGLTVLIAFTRRVRLDLHARNERSRGGLWDFILQAIFVPGATLMLSAVWPLIVAWWTTITGVPSP